VPSVLKKEEKLKLEVLAGHCITYNLKPEVELLYVKQEMGFDVNIRTIDRYKKRLSQDEHTRQWYSDFARFKFVQRHMKHMDDLERMYDDTNQQIFIEQMKTPRNENLIIRLKTLLMDIMLQIGEFQADTPTMDAIRAKLDKAKKIEESEESKATSKQEDPVNA